MESGTQVWGLGVQLLDGDLDPLTGEWWVGPACVWGISGVCVWGTQLGTLIRESPGDPVRLVYNLAS